MVCCFLFIRQGFDASLKCADPSGLSLFSCPFRFGIELHDKLLVFFFGKSDRSGNDWRAKGRRSYLCLKQQLFKPLHLVREKDGRESLGDTGMQLCDGLAKLWIVACASDPLSTYPFLSVRLELRRCSFTSVVLQLSSLSINVLCQRTYGVSLFGCRKDVRNRFNRFAGNAATIQA